jgi:nitrate reductase gamma subunit
MMTVLFLIALYGAYGAFCIRLLLHGFLWWKGVSRPSHALTGRRPSVTVYCRAAGDLLFFTRLLRTNGALWVGEWVFHTSLLLALLRHLRYVLDPVPVWVRDLQPWGVLAGYILPLALIYIVLIRVGTRHEIYSSRSNFFLLITLFVISLTGLMMHTCWKPDLIGIKQFMMGMVTFSPMPWPGGTLFTLHISLFLLIVPYLPTHIFAAPMTIVEARVREDGLREVLRGK